MSKFKFTLLINFRSPIGRQQSSIKFETDSNDPQVVSSARIKAANSILDWRCETIDWMLFDEQSNIVDQFALEY